VHETVSKPGKGVDLFFYCWKAEDGFDARGIVVRAGSSGAVGQSVWASFGTIGESAILVVRMKGFETRCFISEASQRVCLMVEMSGAALKEWLCIRTIANPCTWMIGVGQVIRTCMSGSLMPYIVTSYRQKLKSSLFQSAPPMCM
jgi:hypothetical protein